MVQKYLERAELQQLVYFLISLETQVDVSYFVLFSVSQYLLRILVWRQADKLMCLQEKLKELASGLANYP